MPADAIAIPETEKLRKLLRNCILFSLAWHLLTAWFSVGYHQSDEHFQILEFASYKLGNTPALDLPWEFEAKIRPAIQPAMVFLFQKYIISRANPFQSATIIRICSALFGFGSMVFMLLLGLKMVDKYETKKFLILITTFLWFIPYIHAHFSAESFSGDLFFYGLGCIYLGWQKNKNKLIVLGGFLIGLAFVSRPQTGFMLIGLAIWCIYVAKMDVNRLLMICLPFGFALMIGMGIDRWFYGEWVNTTWNYLKVNVLEGKAADFGVSPWYSYFTWNLLNLIPPYSLFIIAGIIYALIKYRTNIFSLTVIPFLLGHLLLSHKEARFLFPMLGAVPILIAFSYQDLYARYVKKVQWQKVFLYSFLGVNVLMLGIAGLKPASDNIGLYKFVYQHYNGKQAILFCDEDNPYSNYDLHVYYYTPDDIEIHSISDNAGIDKVIKYNKNPHLLILFSRQIEADRFIQKYPHAQLVYRNIPEWSVKYNFFSWLNRTRFWVLYEVR